MLRAKYINPKLSIQKNWLFCDTPNGALSSAIVYTMVEIAKVNGESVCHQLTNDQRLLMGIKGLSVNDSSK